MLQRSSLNYDEINKSPSFFNDHHRTKDVFEEYYCDSTPMSLSSTPEITSTGSYHDETIPQNHLYAALQPRVEGQLCSVYEIHTPLVVSAPTGSGKTVIFELAIIRLLMKLDELKYEGDFIIVYMAPVKALCSERYFDWKTKFSSLGINCQEVTGDSDDYTLAHFPRSHLILTTPEKWDSLTRKWKDNTKMVQLVKLFLIDEVHLLSEEKRGPTLEAVVSRMKTITDVLRKQKLQHKDASDSVQLPLGIRFMAVSATIFNIEDVASWLGASPDMPAKYLKISEEQRPVKLQKIVIGYPCPSGYSQFRFEISLSFKLKPLLFKYAEGKPTLIFCSTRKGVDQTCSTLSQQITFSFDEQHHRQLLETAQMLTENKLKSYIVAGIGYHHAGMDRDDRHTVENLFRAGLLPVLVTTSTLAIGVNLPAHLVIIKATQQYAGGAYHDYTETQILQMIGRAGRPQYDTSAVAIIMTKESQKSRYENLIEGKEPLESNLHRHLAEHLNSEIVLHTITEVGHAIEWIRSTFLYVRALQNPCHYGIPAKLSKKGIETKLQEMCQRELNALASANLITVDNLTDIRPTANGAIMARFYLGLGTMKIFKKVTGQESMEDLLNLISACDEFSGLKLRVNEKKNLNLLNKSKDHETIRFPLRGKITSTEMKVNCLIQALFGCLPIYEQSLKQDMLRISWTGERVTMALCQYLLQYKHYRVLLHATILAKCFRCKLWENSPYVSRQLRGIGPALSSLLVASQKTSFQAIAESNPRDIELILNRAPPMGDALKAEVSHLPKFELRVEPVSLQPRLTKLNVYIQMSNKHLVEEYNAAGDNHWLVLIVGTSDNLCLLIERFRDTYLLQDILCRSVTIKHQASTEIYINLVSEQWSGLDVSLTTKFDESCQAKDNLDKYLLKVGIDSRGKSALQISSEAASVMKKRKRSSLSQEIKAINENSFFDGNRLTLDKFKFTPMRNKKLAPSKQCVVDYNIYENKCIDEGDTADEYPAVTAETMEDAHNRNMPTMGNLQLTHAKEQPDVNDTSDGMPNNFRQTNHCLQKRNNDSIIQSTFCDTTFKYNHFKVAEGAKCINPEPDDSEINAGSEVLYTEPSDALDTPYIIHMQESKSSKPSSSHLATNENTLCNANSNITGWNRLIRNAHFKELQPILETIDLTQDCGAPKSFPPSKSSFTEMFHSNETCKTNTSSFPNKSVSQGHQTKQAKEDSSYACETSQAERFLKRFKMNHQHINAQRISSAKESPGSVNSHLLSYPTGVSANTGKYDLHGNDELRQMIMLDTQQNFQCKSAESDSSSSKERTNLSKQKNYSDVTIQINEEMNQLASETTNITQKEQKYKKTLAKGFYPLFMKPDTTYDNDQDKSNEKRETHAESENAQSATMQTETSPSSEVSTIQPQQTSSQTDSGIQENEEQDDTEVEETREGSPTGNGPPTLKPHECEYLQVSMNSESGNNKQQQFHSITPQINNSFMKSISENIQEKTAQSIPVHLSPKEANTQASEPFPDFPYNCQMPKPALRFSLVPNFDKFFEKLSSGDQNSKQNNETEKITLTPTAKYTKAWARDYLLNRKTKTPVADENNGFFQHYKTNRMLENQTVMQYNVPTFNKKNINRVPLNYIEAGPHITDEPYGTQTNKAPVNLKTNNTAEYPDMAEELQHIYSVNKALPISESRKIFVPQITNKKYFNSFAKLKHNDTGHNPNNQCRDFADVTENAHIYEMEYSSPLPSSSFVSSEPFHWQPQHSEVSDDLQIIDTHRIKQKHKLKSNQYEKIENNNLLYEDSNAEEISTNFHTTNNELFQKLTPTNSFEDLLAYPEEQTDSYLAGAEEIDEVYSNGSPEEEIQDYNQYTSVFNSPLTSNASPQKSECCDLPTPPLQLSDESDNCSQCSTCNAETTAEDIKSNNKTLLDSEQQATKLYSNTFSINNNLPLSLPTHLPVSNTQQVKQKHPATQYISDSEYKRPRSIYLPNDKLQKFYPLSVPGRKIKFSPAYKKFKWIPK